MLVKIKLIGAYDDGLGFGNISQRKDYSRYRETDSPQFIISGTQTGHLPVLTGEHYTRVVDFDIDAFTVTAQGMVRASSETVTHGSIYEMNPNIKAIIHFHHKGIWQKMIDTNYPGTGKWAIYGTPEMALGVKECVGDNTQGIFVMKGHEEGGVAYGPSLNATVNIIAKTYKAFIDPKFTI
jgi:ribulose-5-phosphate 4-epimerase/fuculose-1-phosphate aldolase